MRHALSLNEHWQLQISQGQDIEPAVAGVAVLFLGSPPSWPWPSSFSHGMTAEFGAGSIMWAMFELLLIIRTHELIDQGLGLTRLGWALYVEHNICIRIQLESWASIREKVSMCQKTKSVILLILTHNPNSTKSFSPPRKNDCKLELALAMKDLTSSDVEVLMLVNIVHN